MKETGKTHRITLELLEERKLTEGTRLLASALDEACWQVVSTDNRKKWIQSERPQLSLESCLLLPLLLLLLVVVVSGYHLCSPDFQSYRPLTAPVVPSMARR